MAKAQDIIKNFMHALDYTDLSGEPALDEAIRSVSRFSDLTDLMERMVADCKSYKGDATKFLKEKCGIILNNADTGAITGSDAGGVLKTASSIIPETGELTNLTGESFSTNGLNIIFEKSLGEMTSTEKYIADAMYTWWMKNSLDLIEESYGLSYKLPETPEPEPESTETNLPASSTETPGENSDTTPPENNSDEQPESTDTVSTETNPPATDTPGETPGSAETPGESSGSTENPGSTETPGKSSGEGESSQPEIIYSNDKPSVNNIYVKFENQGNTGVLASTILYVTDDYKITVAEVLNVNTYYYNTGLDITSPDGASSTPGATYLDRTIAHEMVHAVMAANINYFARMPGMFSEGSAELIHGIDDERLYTIWNLAANSSMLEDAFYSDSATKYSAGYMLLRYLGKQASSGIYKLNSTAQIPTLEEIINSGNTTSTPASSTGSSSGNSNSGSSSSSSGSSKTPTSSGSGNSNSGTTKQPSTPKTPTSSGSSNSGTSKTPSTPATPASSGSSSSGSSRPTSYSGGGGSSSTPSKPVTTSGSKMTLTGKVDSDIFLSGKNPFTGEKNSYGNDKIKNIDASGMTSKHFLGGNAQNNSIVAGRGGGSVWGGSGGNDTLVGGAGKDVFYYAAHNGNDTFKNFTAGTGSSADVLTLYKGAGLKSFKRTGEKIIFKMNDNGKLTVMTSDADVDDAINCSTDGKNTSAIKIGNTSGENTFSYVEKIFRYYGSKNHKDTLEITGDENVDVRLSKKTFSNLDVIDASGSTGKNNLYGNGAENTIQSGSGTNKLWGGSGTANDTLIGNSGTDNFYYGKNQGNDVIKNAGEGDYIRLYNVKASDINSKISTGSGVKLNIGSGSLTVDKIDGVTFVLKGGAHYNYSTDSNKFRKA